MGMFDYVHIEVPMPDGSDNTREFQTKAFDWPQMEHYTIASDGRLMLDPTEHVPEEERPYWGKPEWDTWGAVCGMLRRAPERRAEVKPPYHGDIDICHWDGKALHEYIARFTHGRLESIEATDNCFAEPNPMTILERDTDSGTENRNG